MENGGHRLAVLSPQGGTDGCWVISVEVGQWIEAGWNEALPSRLHGENPQRGDGAQVGQFGEGCQGVA